MEQRLIDDGEIVEQSASYICTQLENAVTRGATRIVLGLSGGNSPKALYAQLAQLLSPRLASTLALIQIDERVVDAQHSDSNQNLIREHAALLLEKGAAFYPVPVGNASNTQEDRQRIVREYNATISKLFGEAQYKLAILGAGEDGHTASIFPTATQEEQTLAHGEAMVFASLNQHLGYYRISLSYAALFSCEAALFYIPGLAKQSIVRRILDAQAQSQYPASYVLHKHEHCVLIASQAQHADE